jgi:hypothetical protein
VLVTTPVDFFLTPAQGQLKALIQSPYERATEDTYRPYECASLYYVVKERLVDHLAKADDPHTGMSVHALGKQLDVDPRKLKHVLRILGTSGWFVETSEGIFTFTRPALQLREGANAFNWILPQSVTPSSHVLTER